MQGVLYGITTRLPSSRPIKAASMECSTRAPRPGRDVPLHVVQHGVLDRSRAAAI